MTEPTRDPVEELAASLRAMDAPPDDMTRERMARQLREAIAEPLRPRRSWAPLVAVGALAAAAALGWFLRPATPPEVALLDGQPTTLDVPAGATVHASLGARGKLSLDGPARLESAPGREVVELTLTKGRLEVDWDRRHGGPLVVRSPGAVTRVVGTHFVVEASAGHTRVSVQRGVVEVEAKGQRVPLAAGTAFDTDTVAAVAAAPPPAPPPPPPPAPEVAPPPPPVTPEPPVVAKVAPRPRRTLPPPPVIAPPADRIPTTVPSPAPIASAPPAPAPVSPPMAEPQPPPPPSPPAPEPVAPPSADELYRRAEGAMRAGKPADARRLFEQLLKLHPVDALAAPAAYDSARLALEARDFAAAERRLDALLATPRDPALVEPARFLRCRVVAERRGPAAAEPCARAFRRDFPSSAHDADVLALLASAALAAGDCAQAAPLFEEYLRLYPAQAFAGAARDGVRRCR